MNTLFEHEYILLVANIINGKDYQELNREGEAAGLYKNSKLIGFKKNWQELIEKQGYKLVNGRLIRCGNNG